MLTLLFVLFTPNAQAADCRSLNKLVSAAVIEAVAFDVPEIANSCKIVNIDSDRRDQGILNVAKLVCGNYKFVYKVFVSENEGQCFVNGQARKISHDRY